MANTSDFTLDDVAAAQGNVPAMAANNASNTSDFTLNDVNAAQNEQMSSGTPAISQHGALANFGLGALGAIRNFAQDVADLPPDIAPNLFPRGQLPQVPQGQGFAYGAGKFAGNIAPFVAGGAGLEALRGMTAASDLPVASQVANWLGGGKLIPTLTRQALGGGIYGGITNPQDRIAGMEQGAATSAAFAGLPGLFGGAKYVGGKLASAVQPEKLSDTILDNISGGNNLEQNAQSIASDVKNAYLKNKQDGTNVYNLINDRVGNLPIYNYPLGDYSYGLGTPSIKPSQGLYDSLPASIKSTFSPEAKRLDQVFSNDPSFSNAHALQSQLGKEIGQLSHSNLIKPLESDQATQLDNYSQARTALVGNPSQGITGDMGSFLQNTDPNLKTAWENNTANWRKNVVPYQSDKTLYAMAQGKLANPTPSQIKSVFSNPEPSILKVAGDLPAETNNKIMYNSLARNPATQSAQNLADDYTKLSGSGMGSYVTPQLAQQIELLKNTIGRRNLAQKIGASSLFAVGAPHGAETAGAIIGSLINPTILTSATKRLPLSSITDSLSKLVSNSYPYISTAARANLIPGGQQ